MKFIHRLAYFSGGLSLGIVFLIFFLSGKKTSCDYGPNARTLKHIRVKKRTFNANALHFFNNNTIDTSYITKILQEGDVDFSKSGTYIEPEICDTFFIAIPYKNQNLAVSIKNCDSLATILAARFYTE